MLLWEPRVPSVELYIFLHGSTWFLSLLQVFDNYLSDLMKRLIGTDSILTFSFESINKNLGVKKLFENNELYNHSCQNIHIW